MKYIFAIFSVFLAFQCFAQSPDPTTVVEISDQQYESAQKIVADKIAQDKAKLEKQQKAIKQAQESLDDQNAAEHEKNVSNELEKWNLGFGIGVEQYRNPYIESASLNGTEHIVTLEEQYRTRPSAWLTTNWPFKWQNHKNWGFFVGVKVIDPTGEAFSAFSLGPQYTFLTEDLKKISVGLGWVTHVTKQLADGIKIGEPLPSQYDEIKYVKSTENSVMLMFTIGI